MSKYLPTIYLALLIVGVSLYSIPLKGQQPTTQDCFGAIPVCTAVYVETTAPSGFGSFSNEIDNTISCLFDDDNAIWYTFTVNSSGNFGFVLTPNDPSDDYDWGLFNLTNASCSEIPFNPSLLVSCNSAGGEPCHGATGANGDSRYAIQGGGCESPAPDLSMGQTPFNDFIPVFAGNTYTLMVSNWTGSTNGYKIDFSVSEDIGIIDKINPEIRNIFQDQAVACSPTQLIVEFTEAIRCNTIDLENYVLRAPDGSTYNVLFSSPICAIGGEYSREFIIDVVGLLPATGVYTLEINPTEALKVLDLCGNPFASFNYTFPVTIAELNEIPIPSDTVLCEVSSLILDVSDTSATNYLWSDGSTSSINEITTSGDYSVEISNSCESKTANIRVDIIRDRDVIVDLGSDTTLCLGETITLNPNLTGNYTFIWEDGIAAFDRTISTSGTYAVTVSDLCGPLGNDEVKLTFVDRSITVELGSSPLLCTGETITLDAADPNGDNYLWSDGSTLPRLQVSTGGTYSVEVSNECVSVSDEIIINESSCVKCNVYVPNSFTPNRPGPNNELKVTSNCTFESYRMRIFDRWGTEIFHSTDPNDSWTGFIAGNPSNVGSGIYVYVIRYSYFEFNERIEVVDNGDILIVN